MVAGPLWLLFYVFGLMLVEAARVLALEPSTRLISIIGVVCMIVGFVLLLVGK